VRPAGRHELDPRDCEAARSEVVEDACEAIGAEYNGRRVGTLGDAGTFAFYPNKQMTTAEGGMLVTNRSEWASLFASLRNQGRGEMGEWLAHERLGYNYRLSELSGALGVVQSDRLDTLLDKRSRVAAAYSGRLADVPHVDVPYVAPSTTRMSWFVYVVRIKDPLKRDEVIRRLADVGVPSRAYFPAIHLQPYFRSRFGYEPGNFPVTERLSRESLALPFHANLTDPEIDYVCDHLRRIASV
jgi:dTDP-4-amino-4,6-dideoxygalactose transaminase